MNKPCAAACDQNREPIESVLSQFVEGRSRVLEIGSGTGQHAVYFGARFPWLSWQTSDLLEHHAGINAWIDDNNMIWSLPPIPCTSWTMSRLTLLLAGFPAACMRQAICWCTARSTTRGGTPRKATPVSMSGLSNVTPPVASKTLTGFATGQSCPG